MNASDTEDETGKKKNNTPSPIQLNKLFLKVT